MNEAVFPLIGPLFVVAVALPLCAVIAKALLLVLERLASLGLHVPLGVRYAILVASSVVPLAWFVSAGLHQAETGQSALVCMVTHAAGVFCVEAVCFAVSMSLFTGLLALPRLVREQLLPSASVSLSSSSVRQRIASLLESSAGLRKLRGRVVVSDTTRLPIATVGFVAPRVVVQTAFAEALDDEALAGALQHELGHVRGRDPLRYFLAWCALAINPLGRWLLRREHAGWVLDRESQCDREAVLNGASPLGLAYALVAAARPRTLMVAPALGSSRLEGLKLRVKLLLSYTERRPSFQYDGPALRLVALLVLLALVLPHGSGTEPLDAVHKAAETSFSLLMGH